MKKPTFAIFLFLLPFLCLGYTNVEPPPTFAKNVLTDNKTIDAPKNIHMEKQPFEFLESSKVMYEKLCEAVPWFIRPLIRSSILKGIEEHGCQEVTETCLYQVVKQVTPKKHIKRTLELLDQHKTT
jgi:hypothetical protein